MLKTWCHSSSRRTLDQNTDLSSLDDEIGESNAKVVSNEPDVSLEYSRPVRTWLKRQPLALDDSSDSSVPFSTIGLM